METVQKYYYHKIPTAEQVKAAGNTITVESKKTPYFIGIIDSSGSMSSWWKHVAKNYNELTSSLATPIEKMITFCFDSSIHPVPGNQLKDDIYAHGGSMTNIYKAMQRLDNELAKIPIGEEVKVCFVSDGQDTCNSNLDNLLKQLKGARRNKLTFMCIGVQSGFPTKVSMFLREKYHRGDGSVPSIFLIEYASDKAFFNKFQTAKGFCSVKEDMTVDPPQRVVPWEAPINSLPEGIWIMSQQKTITLGGTYKLECKDEDFSVNAICDVFRSWSQKLQVDSLNKKITFPQAQEYAMSCLGLMQNLIDDVKKSRDLDILSGTTSSKGNFLASVLNLQIMRTSMRIKGYLNSVKEIRDGKDLGNLSEYEAAKIIGLGTIVGKAQQRALALKNMTTEKLQTYVSEFLEVLNKIELKPETGFKKSFKSERTFNDLVNDSTLPAGLKKFESPLDFLDTFPLHGVGLSIKRSDGYLNDPYKCSVKSYSKDKIVDTTTFDFHTHRLTISPEEDFNCVCPLIPAEDAHLAPLYETNLMKYIMSYTVTEQLDSINEESWVVALSDLFVLALKGDDDKLMGEIVQTITALKGEGYWAKVIEGIEIGDTEVYKVTKRRSTFLLAHYYYAKTADLEPEELDELIQKLWIFYFGHRLKKGTINEFVVSQAGKDLKKKIFSIYTPEHILENFYTSKGLVRHLKKNIIKELAEIEAESVSDTIHLVPGGFTADTNLIISFKLVKKLVSKIRGEDQELGEELTYQLLAHVTNHPADFLEHVLEITTEEAKKALCAKFSASAGKKMKRKIQTQMIDKLQKVYFKEFKQRHWNTLPLSLEQVIEECKARGIDWEKLEWDETNKFTRNACMSADCSHRFVVKTKRKLRNHLGGWQGLCPRAFHLFIKLNLTKPPTEVYKEFILSKNIKDIAAYGVTEEKVIEYIENIQAQYNN